MDGDIFAVRVKENVEGFWRMNIKKDPTPHIKNIRLID